MKYSLLLLAAALGLSGCASVAPVGGVLYSDVHGPVAVTNVPRGPLRGEACATSYVGLVALGDASTEAAAKAGGINVISHVDQMSSNIVFFITKYCTVVYGHRGGKPAPPPPPAK